MHEREERADVAAEEEGEPSLTPPEEFPLPPPSRPRRFVLECALEGPWWCLSDQQKMKLSVQSMMIHYSHLCHYNTPPDVGRGGWNRVDQRKK